MLTLWMHENECENEPAKCPRPIVVAAAGGASRAGFFMASSIGYFMQEAGHHGLDPNRVRNRLFAISSVSGGSMGAVMVTAALNAAIDSNIIPCAHTSFDQWWGDKVGNWRDCFEALTSGDFLTADFFGFAFNDMLPLGPWRDRAAVLEDSWSARYRQVIPSARVATTASQCTDLDCPFLSLRPRPGHWIPLLVINGTSETMGSRIITTPLALTYTRGTTNGQDNPCPTVAVSSACRLFVVSDRFHDLLSAEVKPAGWFAWFGFFERYLLKEAKGNDIRISTAAHNSARFPLISPPGSIRNNQQQIVDRIVDGGYFENYGALGATELALAIHAVQPELYPLIIVISNDPNDTLGPDDDVTPNSPPPNRPYASSSELVTDVTAPLTTFANARTAHGILAVDQVRSTLHAAMSCPILMVQIRVWPDHGKDLSMSWWESSPVQRQLHQQTEDGKAQNQNGRHLATIWNQMNSVSGCAASK
jgi:hypothetical protein